MNELIPHLLKLRNENSIIWRPTIVAEVKLKSPYGWQSPFTQYDMLKLCAKVGDIVSIHTHPAWGGSWSWLEEAVRIVGPSVGVVAKGFHPCQYDVNRAFDCGAEYAVTVDWWNGDDFCWYEPSTLFDVYNSAATYTIINSRCPRNGATRDWPSLDQIRQNLVNDTALIQASGIKSPEDIKTEKGMILIGQGLYENMTQAELNQIINS